MNDEFLKNRLRKVARRYQWIAFWRKLAVTWALAALVGVVLVWVQRATGYAMPLALPVLAAVAAGVATALSLMHCVREPD